MSSLVMFDVRLSTPTFCQYGSFTISLVGLRSSPLVGKTSSNKSTVDDAGIGLPFTISNLSMIVFIFVNSDKHVFYVHAA